VEKKLKTIKIQDIRFPCYALKCTDTPYVKNKVTYCIYLFNNKEYIIDNKNIAGNTLGSRRQKLDKEVLLPITISALNIVGFLKLYRKTRLNYHIDTNGTIFKYKPSVTAKLESKEVVSAKYSIDGINTMIYIKGRSAPFILPYTSNILDYPYIYTVDIPGVGLLLWELLLEFKETKRIRV
jgi:hypothetical protein